MGQLKEHVTMGQKVTGDELRAAVCAALVSRGKLKGSLLRKCPQMHTDAAAAWQALMLSANPYKASISAMLLFSERQRIIHNAVMDLTDIVDVRGLDRDRVNLELLGAWQ